MTRLCSTVVFCGLLSGAALVAQPASPRDLLEQFCKLDAAGEQLSGGGAVKIRELFTDPRPSVAAKVAVIRKYELSRGPAVNAAVAFYVIYDVAAWFS